MAPIKTAAMKPKAIPGISFEPAAWLEYMIVEEAVGMM